MIAAVFRKRDYAVRAFLWAGAFLSPAVWTGFVVPHGPYVIVPVLAAYDRLTVRRMFLWVALTAAYELLYHIPTGSLAVPVAACAAGASLARRFMRGEPLDAAPDWSVVPLARAVVHAAVWAAALVGLSWVIGTFIGGQELSVISLKVTWSSGAVWTLAGSIIVALAVLHRTRVPFTRRIMFGT